MVKVKDLKEKVEKELQHFREFIEQEGIDKAIEAKAEELRKLQLRKEELKKRMSE